MGKQWLTRQADRNTYSPDANRLASMKLSMDKRRMQLPFEPEFKFIELSLKSLTQGTKAPGCVDAARGRRARTRRGGAPA